MEKHILASAFAVLLLVFNQTAEAATNTITNTKDNGSAGSLRYVLLNAASGDVINFAPALSGQIISPFHGGITLTANIVIDASALTNAIQINNYQLNSLFTVSSGVTVLMNSLIIAGGISSGPGGSICNQGNLTLINCTLSNNLSYANGGGIYNDQNANLTMTNCTVAGNMANGGFGGFNGSGGGIYNYYYGTATVSDSTISGNSAVNGSFASGGGGIYNQGALTVNNSTLAANSSSEGGGIWNTFGTAAVTNCTFSGNSASDGGGIFNQALLSLANSIVAGNINGDGDDLDNINLLNFSGNNLTSGDPMLAALGNYGGPTQTMPPLPGSPAIDAGSDAVAAGFATDQRGYPRFAGTHVDLGAVELQQATVTTLTASNIATNNATLNGTVNPDGLVVTWYFQYGLDATYGNFSPTNTLTAGSNSMPVNYLLTSLAPGTVYHYQILANDGVSIKAGGDAILETPGGVPSSIPPVLNGPMQLGNGAFQFSFTNITGANFTIHTSTNAALPLADWPALGSAMETPAGSGHYQFTDPLGANSPQRYYRVVSP